MRVRGRVRLLLASLHLSGKVFDRYARVLRNSGDSRLILCTCSLALGPRGSQARLPEIDRHLTSKREFPACMTCLYDRLKESRLVACPGVIRRRDYGSLLLTYDPLARWNEAPT